MGEAKESNVKWQYLWRDDEYVKKRFLAKDYDWALKTGLGNLDGILAFFLQVGVPDLFDFRPALRERVMIPLVKLLSSYSMKVLLQISGVSRLDPLLFREKALLRLIGFAAMEIKEGFCNRGKGKSRPFHPTTLGKLLRDITTAETNQVFANSVRLLKKNGFCPQGVFAVDGTPLEVDKASHYEGAGKITYTKKKKNVTQVGYKLVGMRCVDKKAPNIFVSGKVFPLNHNACNDLLPLLDQAQGLVGPGKIKWVVVDREFLSGENIWEVKHTYKVDVLIYSKKNMDVTKEMRKRLKEAEEYKKKYGVFPKDVFYQTDGQMEAYGFNNLKWFWTYGGEEHQAAYQKEKYKKYPEGYQPKPISGVLITRYKGKDLPSGKEITLLSTRKITPAKCPPLKLVAIYRRRQRIENLGFRELKQGWQLNKFPGRRFPAVYFHIFLTLLMSNLFICYQSKKGQAVAGKGIRSLRIKDFGSTYGVVLIADDYYGVFEIEQVLSWAGVPPKYFQEEPPFQ